MFCEKCGSQIDEGKKICPNCGISKQRKEFCQHCGQMIDFDCVVCTSCGKQVEELKVQQPQVVVNNVNTNTNLTGAMHGQRKKTSGRRFCFDCFLEFLARINSMRAKL